MRKKTKKSAMRGYSYAVVVGVIGVLAIGSAVLAFSGSFSGSLFEHAETVNIYGSSGLVAGESGIEEESLGAVNLGKNITVPYNFTQGFYIDSNQIFDGSGNVSLPGTLAVTGATTLSGALTGSGAVDVPTLTEGGGMYTSSTLNATATLPASAIDTENFIDFTPNVNTTLTLPATSTLSSIIPTAGDTRQIFIRNASSTAASSITLAAGTGIDLQYSEATGGDLVLSGLDVGVLTFTRLTNTDILVLFDEFTEAD